MILAALHRLTKDALRCLKSKRSRAEAQLEKLLV
jgi:hypothetical protein